MTRKLLLEKICLSDCTYNCVILDSCDCDYCNVKLSELLDEYDKHVIEQYKADTNLKDTIRDIHDNVAKEMYYKGIDDFVHKVKEHHYVLFDVVTNGTDYGMFTFGIEQIAEELKEQNES